MIIEECADSVGCLASLVCGLGAGALGAYYGGDIALDLLNDTDILRGTEFYRQHMVGINYGIRGLIGLVSMTVVGRIIYNIPHIITGR